MKKLLLTLAIGCMMLPITSQAETILVGTDAGYAPYEFKDPKTNEIVGFDIDLITAIAKATGNEAKIQNMQFAGIIPALQSNMIDVAAAGMTITEARKKQVDFSDPYYDVGGLIMAVRSKDTDKYKHMNDLEGKCPLLPDASGSGPSGRADLHLARYAGRRRIPGRVPRCRQGEGGGRSRGERAGKVRHRAYRPCP